MIFRKNHIQGKLKTLLFITTILILSSFLGCDPIDTVSDEDDSESASNTEQAMLIIESVNDHNLYNQTFS